MQRVRKCLPVRMRRSAHRQRYIQGCSFSLTGATLISGTGARIVRILMGGKVKHGRIRPENFLRSVPVMDIPIDDQYALDTVPRLRVSRADSRIIEKAKPHGVRNRGMVTRRPDNAERAFSLT